MFGDKLRTRFAASTSMVLVLSSVALGQSMKPASKVKEKRAPTPPIAAPIWPAAARQDPTKVAALIDRALEARFAKDNISASPDADDAEFLRRVCLDLTGRIPSADRAVAFHDDRTGNKRSKLIDELLAAPEYSRHFANVWYDLLVPRTPILGRINTEAMRNAFAESFDQNVPWSDAIARMIRCQDKDPGKNFLAFYQINGDMGGRPMANVVARTFTRRFMGVRMECAECHDDPFKQWTQREYWGLSAYFGRVALSPDKDGPTIMETNGYTPPKGNNFRLPVLGDGSLTVHEEARYEAGKAMRPKVLDGEDQVFADKAPMLADFINWITAPNNKYLAPAAVNRFWNHLFARGLVDPVDDFRDDNPATHPEVLTLLVEEFTRSHHDVKHLLRCICNSKAYQRTSRPVAGNDKVKDPLYSRMAIKAMTAEMLHDSLCQAHSNPNLFPLEQSRNKKAGTVVIRSQFLRLFKTNDPDGDATEYTAGIPQMLMLLNDPIFNAKSPLVAELQKTGASPEQGVERLYLATLSRRPTAEEIQRKVALIKRHSSLAEGFDGVLWSLVCQAEFVLNR